MEGADAVVNAAAVAAVEEDLAPVADGLDDLRERVEARGHAVELAAAVVRDDDPRGAVLAGEHGVLRREHARGALHRLADLLRVLDPAVDEAVLDALEVLAPAGVGQLVEDRQLVAGVGCDPRVGRSDEPGGAGDEQLHGA